MGFSVDSVGSSDRLACASLVGLLSVKYVFLRVSRNKEKLVKAN